MTTTTPLEAGQIAPDFKLRGPGGAPVTLSEYLGQKNVVLVFFPLAFSGTCAHQLPQVQAAMSEIEALDGVVLGISVDNHYANEAFAKQLGLSFPLLSDFNRETSRAYGVLLQAGFSGRVTFVVDKRGKLAHRGMGDNLSDIAKIPSIEKVVDTLKSLQ